MGRDIIQLKLVVRLGPNLSPQLEKMKVAPPPKYVSLLIVDTLFTVSPA